MTGAEKARVRHEAEELLRGAHEHHIPANWMATVRICDGLLRLMNRLENEPLIRSAKP